LPGVTEENHKTFIRICGSRAETRREDLTNTSLQRYLCRMLLGSTARKKSFVNLSCKIRTVRFRHMRQGTSVSQSVSQ